MRYIPLWSAWLYGLDTACANLQLNNPNEVFFIVWLYVGCVLLHPIGGAPHPYHFKNTPNLGVDKGRKV